MNEIQLPDNIDNLKDAIIYICKQLDIDINRMLSELNIPISTIEKVVKSKDTHFSILLIADYLGVNAELLFNISKKELDESITIYDRIKELCEERGEKISPYFSKLGYASSTVSKWKSNESFKIDTLKQMAKEFNCSVDYLVGLTNQIIPQERLMLSDIVDTFINEFVELDDYQQIELLEFIKYLKFKKQDKINKVEDKEIVIPDKYKDMVDMWNNGMTMTQIAKVKDTTKQNVSLIFKRYNIPTIR